jgi:chromosome segregation ATPase
LKKKEREKQMDTQTMTATERAAELRKKIAALDGRRREAESALARENAAQRDMAARRLALVEELPDADEATTGYLNAEIDDIDSRLLVSSRLVEALSNSTPKLTNEIAVLNAELSEVQGILDAAARAADLKAFDAKVQYAGKEAERALAYAREALSTLNRLSADGCSAFGLPAQRLCDSVFGALHERENNLGRDGWKTAVPAHQPNLGFIVRAVTRQ